MRRFRLIFGFTLLLMLLEALPAGAQGGYISAEVETFVSASGADAPNACVISLDGNYNVYYGDTYYFDISVYSDTEDVLFMILRDVGHSLTLDEVSIFIDDPGSYTLRVEMNTEDLPHLGAFSIIITGICDREELFFEVIGRPEDPEGTVYGGGHGYLPYVLAR